MGAADVDAVEPRDALVAEGNSHVAQAGAGGQLERYRGETAVQGAAEVHCLERIGATGCEGQGRNACRGGIDQVEGSRHPSVGFRPGRATGAGARGEGGEQQGKAGKDPCHRGGLRQMGVAGTTWAAGGAI